MGLRPPNSAKRLQFLAAIRDDIQDVVADLTHEAQAAHAQAALLMEGGGRPLRVALLHGQKRPERYIWKHLSAAQRNQALTHRRNILWWNVVRGGPDMVTWLLDKANLTAAARSQANRPYSAGLVKAMRSAIAGGHSASLPVLWDRATWAEWHEAVRQGFAEAFEEGHIDAVQTVLRLSAPEPKRFTIKKILFPMLEDPNEGLVVQAAQSGRSDLLDVLQPHLSHSENAWLSGLARAAACGARQARGGGAAG